MRTESEKLFKEAIKYFPGGVNSPVRAFKSVGGVPLFIDKGKGSRIWDADGNEYIDYCCSWGPLISGHCHPAIVQRIKEVAELGVTFGAPTRLENELAALILKNHPYIEKLRFVSSGTEAVMSAIRLARGYTGRNKIIKFDGCYHGHADSLLVKAGSGLATLGISSSLGIPKSFANETIVLPLNDEEAVMKAFEYYEHAIACVIIEPIPANNGLLLQRPSYLRFLREISSNNGCLLIFDEVISGFRIGFTGASGYYNIHPDIITYGKIIGGGLPVGAYGSYTKIMQSVSPEGSVYQAGTLSGNPVAMAAGNAQLSECLKPGFYNNLEVKTNRLKNKVMKGIESVIPFNIFTLGSIFWVSFSSNNEIRSAADIEPAGMEKFKLFHAALLEKGVYLGPSGYEVGFVSAAHTDNDIDITAKAMREAVKIALG